MPDRLILGFDTSAAHCAAALLSGDHVLVSRYEEMARGQAERLFPLLNEVMEEAGLTLSRLDAIGVGVGPGNFTGIRISVAAARGLALGLGRPAIGVTTFEIAHAMSPDRSTVVVPGTRGTAFSQDFDEGHPAGEPRMLDTHDAPDMPLGDVTRTGELVARLAAAKLASGDHPARPAPLYIRPADAAPARPAPPVR